VAEEQELKLTVTLDDQASAQLGQLLQTMQSLGGSSGGGTAGMNQFAQSLRGAGGHAQTLHGTLAGMAAKGGFIGGFFFAIGEEVSKMGKELANAVLNIREYADAMVSLEQAASRAATTAAQFQQNIASMRESGISAEAAAKNIQGFTDALGDLQREQSKTRQDLLGGLYGVYREDMQSLIQRVTGADKQQAFNEIVKFSRQIREYHTARGNAELGAVAEKEFLARWGIPDADKMRDTLETVTPELEGLYKKRMDNAERMQTAFNKMGDATDRGVRSIQASALYMLPLTEAMEGFGEIVSTITKMLQDWESLIGGEGHWEAKPGEGQNPEQEPGTFNDRFGSPNKGPQTWRLPLPGTPGPEAPQTWWDKLNPFDTRNLKPEELTAEEREGRLRDALTRKGQERLGGGAQQLLGGGDEDRRSSIVSNTDQVKSVTEELKRLNDYFELQQFKGGKVGLLGDAGLRAGTGAGAGNPMGTSGPPGTGPGSGPGTGPQDQTQQPPAIQWPEPSAGNVMPQGFGTPESGGGYGVGVPGAGNFPAWTGTVAPGSGGAYEGKPVATPEGWGPGGSGQPWGTTGGGGAPGAAGGGGGIGGSGGSGDLDRGKYDAMFKGTPLEGQYDTVVKEAAKNNVPASVMAGIISFETGKGTSKMVRERLNPAGLMDPKTGMKKGQTFKTIEEGIAAAGRTIGHRYNEAGGDLQEMAKVYAPVGAKNDPNRTNVQWPGSVSKVAQQLSAGQQNPVATNQPASPNQKVASTDSNVPVGTNAPGNSTPGVSQGLTGPQALAIARQHLGENEIKDQTKLSAWFRERGMKLNPGATPWCAAFVNASLAQAGLPTSKDSPGSKTPSLAAASFYKYGTAVDPKDVRPGDIAVWPHHVAFTTSGVGPGGTFGALGGNQGGRSQQGGGVTTDTRSAKGVTFRRPPPGSYNPAAPANVAQQPGSRPGAVPYLLPGGTAIPSSIDAPDITPIDRSATKKVAVSGNGKVDVSVKTEPKQAASKKDLVKDVPIPRHRQMQPAPTGPDHDAALDS
jgi:hypothetical protein